MKLLFLTTVFAMSIGTEATWISFDESLDNFAPGSIVLPKHIDLHLQIFYDKDFTGRFEKVNSKINRLMGRVKGFFRFPSLTTKINLNVVNKTYLPAKYDVDNTNFKTFKDFKHLLMDDQYPDSIDLFLMLSADGPNTLGKPTSDFEGNVCSQLKEKRAIMVEHVETETETVNIIVQMIAYALGIFSDDYRKDTNLNDCSGSLMGNEEVGGWSTCSVEDLTLFYGQNEHSCFAHDALPGSSCGGGDAGARNEDADAGSGDDGDGGGDATGDIILPKQFNVDMHIFFDKDFKHRFGLDEEKVNLKINRLMDRVRGFFRLPSLSTQINLNVVNKTYLPAKYDTDETNYLTYWDFRNLLWDDQFSDSIDLFLLLSAYEPNTRGDTIYNFGEFVCSHFKDHRTIMVEHVQTESETVNLIVELIAFTLDIFPDIRRKDTNGKDCGGSLMGNETVGGWSTCSVEDFTRFFRENQTFCLTNDPFPVSSSSGCGDVGVGGGGGDPGAEIVM